MIEVVHPWRYMQTHHLGMVGSNDAGETVRGSLTRFVRVEGEHHVSFELSQPSLEFPVGTNPRRLWHGGAHSVGLDDLGFHDLRRLNASLLVAQGVNVRTAPSRDRGTRGNAVCLDVSVQLTPCSYFECSKILAERSAHTTITGADDELAADIGEDTGCRLRQCPTT